MKKWTRLAAVGAIAAVVAGVTATGSFADPPKGVVPRHIDIVGTGSDTTTAVIQQFSKDYNKTLTVSTQRRLYSWNATGSANITEKQGCVSVPRPNGSSAGIAELEANAHPSGDTTDHCVDFARSSRARSSTDSNKILFLPFAVDGVTWSADMLTGHTNAVASLTTKQLNAIYNCDASLLGTGKTGPVTWNEVGGTSTAKIIPVIQQSSSGTYAFWLTTIGVTTLGTCVQGQDNSVEENEGTNAIFQNPTTAPNILFPYSIGDYLAQSQNGHGTGTQGHQVLRKVSGIAPTVTSGGKKIINAKFPYLRFLYNVVRNAALHPNVSQVVPKYVRAIFGSGTAGSGWICKSATSKADILSYGFITTSQCGTIQ